MLEVQDTQDFSGTDLGHEGLFVLWRAGSPWTKERGRMVPFGSSLTDILGAGNLTNQIKIWVTEIQTDLFGRTHPMVVDSGIRLP
jgi:hypothetical protein